MYATAVAACGLSIYKTAGDTRRKSVKEVIIILTQVPSSKLVLYLPEPLVVTALTFFKLSDTLQA